MKTAEAKSADRTGAASAYRTAEAIARTALGPRPLPDLGVTRPRRIPSRAHAVTDAGLAITAMRAPSSPMIHLRLRIPFAGDGAAHAARSTLLAETMLLGTATRDREQLDTELAAVGAHLGVRVSPQSLTVSGSVLAPGLPVVLDILADALTGAVYRSSDVERERDKLVEHLAITAAQPATIARMHLQRHRFRTHPAVFEMPDADEVAATTARVVRGLHRKAVLPNGSALILVGDLRPRAVAESAAAALSTWAGTDTARQLSAPPAIVGGPISAHHRPGSVQTQTRLTAEAVSRTDPNYAATQIANVIFAGYFSSRLVENLREDKGFTYHAHSSLEFWPGRSAVTISYDTATDVAAAALVETRHELGRICVTPPSDEEIESARQYVIGSLASSLATQAGYASMLGALLGSGLDAEWLAQHQRNLAAVTDAEVAAAAATLWAPGGVTGVIVGDLDVSGEALLRLGGVEIPD